MVVKKDFMPSNSINQSTSTTRSRRLRAASGTCCAGTERIMDHAVAKCSGKRMYSMEASSTVRSGI